MCVEPGPAERLGPADQARDRRRRRISADERVGAERPGGRDPRRVVDRAGEVGRRVVAEDEAAGTAGLGAAAAEVLIVPRLSSTTEPMSSIVPPAPPPP
jgi:hypothetical protein